VAQSSLAWPDSGPPSGTRGETIADARESRFWEKQTVAYEQALAELVNRQARLQRVNRKLFSASKPTEVLKEYFAAQDRPAWFSAEVMLLAYSSTKVRDALDNARSADFAASEILDKLQKAWQEVGATEPVAKFMIPGTDVMLREMFDASRKVDATDQALVNAIRAELQGARGK
jgi:hypothetical protein